MTELRQVRQEAGTVPATVEGGASPTPAADGSYRHRNWQPEGGEGVPTSTRAVGTPSSGGTHLPDHPGHWWVGLCGQRHIPRPGSSSQVSPSRHPLPTE